MTDPTPDAGYDRVPDVCPHGSPWATGERAWSSDGARVEIVKVYRDGCRVRVEMPATP